ncbi:MAG: Gfo/Idh/MocA family oxidoreductase [Planctomycetota bacterium]|nr:Gfo/Idh/MocA family oxidoreductase [Planctomycetota bacterium]MDA1212264.1 Gfo/Idh/MocA family oxidoreductase [Planctomycetota bacterium]
MIQKSDSSFTRRHLLKNTGKVAAATAIAGLTMPQLYAGETNTINVALIGCGGRGTGAASNALSVDNGPIKLRAMADVFPNRLSISHDHLKSTFEQKFDVSEDRKFIGFDGYKQAMDTLNPGDIVILTTPPAFRWLHFGYAIEKGLNVFMEKPTTVDGPSTRKMLQLAELSAQKNLKVGVGLMCRHCTARRELFDRIQSGEIGDLVLLRAYRQAGPTGSAFVKPRPDNISELMYQIQNFHGFLWASGGAFSDFLIHNIDECCWMKDSWPVQAKSSGGRHYREGYIDQNFDSYSTEYTFADGSKLYLEGRCMVGCDQEFASYAHGSKGSAVISTSSHAPSKARSYSSQNFSKENLIWAFPQPEPNPYQLEWDHLIDAIREDKPYNEAERGAIASLVTSMGRMAAHTGQLVTYEDILNHDHEFAPQIADLVIDGPAPLQADAEGMYPIPLPGINKQREYDIL